MIRYFVVLSYGWSKRGILFPHDPIEVPNMESAIRLAERLAADCAGVVAFSRTGDPTTGEFEDAEVLMRSGVVPELDGYPMALAKSG